MSGRRLLVLLFVLTLPLVSPRLRGADEIEYFAWLRSAAFDRDLDFANEYRHFYERDPQGLQGFRQTFLELREPLTGRHINFGPLGSALLWSPFYLLAHLGVLVARALGAGVAADGFSLPYVAAACYGSAVWGFAGLLLAHDALRRFFDVPEPAASWSVAALWLATPVLYYLTVAPGFSHGCSLFAVALTLWLFLRWREAGAARWALVGAAGGLAALVREQDGLFLVAPGLWLLFDLWRRRDLRAALRRGLALGLAAFAVFAPQMLAYRALNGTFGPSPLVKRKMSWSSPHFLEVLFDPAHGLYLWSPLLLVATLGLWWAWRRRRDSALPCLAAALLLQAWINGAVESWTQAGAFGSRRFVGATFVFAIGLAALAGRPSAAPPPSPRGRVVLGAVLGVFVWWNVSLMAQFGLKLMDRQGLTWPAVAVNQFTAVPRRLGRTLWLYLTDREQLVRESR